MATEFVRPSPSLYDIVLLVFSILMLVFGIALILIQFVPVTVWSLKNVMKPSIQIDSVSASAVITGTTGNYSSADMMGIALANSYIDGTKGQGVGLVLCSSFIVVLSVIAIIVVSVKLNRDTRVCVPNLNTDNFCNTINCV